jgi:hypothetical protein
MHGGKMMIFFLSLVLYWVHHIRIPSITLIYACMLYLISVVVSTEGMIDGCLVGGGWCCIVVKIIEGFFSIFFSIEG